MKLKTRLPSATPPTKLASSRQSHHRRVGGANKREGDVGDNDRPGNGP